MKTALYFGGDKGLSFEIGLFRKNPATFCTVRVMDYDLAPEMVYIFSLSIWKFAVELLWFY
jgi:hypothetical protein